MRAFEAKIHTTHPTWHLNFQLLFNKSNIIDNLLL
jgi:hypothetical protein